MVSYSRVFPILLFLLRWYCCHYFPLLSPSSYYFFQQFSFRSIKNKKNSILFLFSYIPSLIPSLRLCWSEFPTRNFPSLWKIFNISHEAEQPATEPLNRCWSDKVFISLSFWGRVSLEIELQVGGIFLSVLRKFHFPLVCSCGFWRDVEASPSHFSVRRVTATPCPLRPPVPTIFKILAFSFLRWL